MNGWAKRVTIVRAWAITIMGIAGIVWGIKNNQASWVMTGFAVLGSEPQLRTVGRERGTPDSV
jgi:hypothetical protein